MARPPSSAGGLWIAIGCIAGAFIGLFRGQATIGFLVGAAIGVAAATLMWLRERRG